MKRFLLAEVLIVNVTRASRVDPYEVILARILNECVSNDVSDARVQRRYLLHSHLLLLISNPVFRVTPTPILIVSHDAML